jgi:hypothetical protein
MEGRARHRPRRRFPEAKRVIVACELERCVYCGSALVNRKTWHTRKYVQTMQGPVFVAGRTKECANSECAHRGVHYYAGGVALISLPHSTYGLDVLAYIGWQHEQAQQQLVEIQRSLSARGVAINERNVGKLYRQFLALLGGMDAQKEERLRGAAQRYGGIIWAMDALQPEGCGTLLYVLYEVLSGTVVSALEMSSPTAEELAEWVKPWQGLALRVLATLSDGEKAIVQALRGCWPEAPHQQCQLHFLGDVAEAGLAYDRRLRQRLRDKLGGLPRVPEQTLAPTPPGSTSPSAVPPFGDTARCGVSGHREASASLDSRCGQP